MNGRILFVDDEPLMRSTFQRRFRSLGWSVDVASGGEEALRRLEVHDYDAMVTDLRMPRIDGRRLIERARAEKPSLGFVIVTGIPDLDAHRDDIEFGVAVIAKPWNEKKLLAAINESIRPSASEEPTVDVGNQVSVLLIEDEPGDVALFNVFLETSVTPAIVEACDRLSTALERVRVAHFDVVVLDLELPDAAGLESVDRIKAVAPDCAIIVVTGRNDDDVAYRAMKLGVQDYLPKDELDPVILSRALRYAVGRKQAEQRVALLARRDMLTGLANRMPFAERMEETLIRTRRTAERTALLIVDLDGFTQVNDTYGYEVGDVVLREVATRLIDCNRSFDFVARLGGDQFAVLISAHDDDTVPERIANRIIQTLAYPVPVRGSSVPVSACVGVARVDGRQGDSAKLLRSADFAMRAAKRAGPGSIRVFDEIDDPRSTRRLQLMADLSNALEEERFVLHYQPQFDLTSDRAIGAEALLRWRRSSGVLVPPNDFIPLLEESGLIVDVGAWVLNAACQKVRGWHDEGADEMRVAVNLSAKQFDSEGLTETVEQAIARTGVHPSWLELEITEGLLMRDTERTSRTLSALKSLGVRIALDDFGTGYSSLAYLERFEVDVLKIDRSFVASLHEQKSGSSVAGAIVQLGQRLGLEVIAEGVETEAQLRRLRDEGCDVVQGFLLGRPSETWSPSPARQADVA